jgi:rod shape determining protein RodA
MSFFQRVSHEIRYVDLILPLSVFVLICVGLVSLYSIDLSKGTELRYFGTQIIALILGSVGAFIAGSLHSTRYRAASRLVYFFALLLLGGVLIFGQTIRGTTGWFRFFGFSFQPVEVAKVALILILGRLVYKNGRRFDSFRFLFSTVAVTGLLCGLIMLQPDLGSTLILFGIWFSVLFMTGIQKRYIFGFILVGLLVAVFAWFFFLKEYQKERILTFANPERDPLGTGYNVTQSIIAIGAGQFLGRGLGQGSQSQLHFVPEAQTDFIVAVIGEELGFLGLLFVLFLYGVIIYRLVRISRRARDDFSAYTALGIASLFLLHLVINLGGAMGILPVTGVTLPFVSYGGSSLMVNLVLIGIAESISRSTEMSLRRAG